MNCLPKVMILVSFFLLSFASNLNSVDAETFFAPPSPVLVVTSADWKDKVVNSENIVLVEFYAPWCGYCKALTPIWEKTATVMNGVVTVAAINTDEHKDIGQEYKLPGVPIIMIFVPGKPPVEYKGARELVPIVEFVHSQVRELLKERLNAA